MKIIKQILNISLIIIVIFIIPFLWIIEHISPNTFWSVMKNVKKQVRVVESEEK